MKNYYKRVLVVDDEAADQLLIKKALKNIGLECDVAINGEDAITHLEFIKYELIITDIIMPNMNGFELCDYIRNHFNNSISKTKIIAMSSDNKLEQNSLLKSANSFIKKPFNVPNFLKTVESHLC